MYRDDQDVMDKSGVYIFVKNHPIPQKFGIIVFFAEELKINDFKEEKTNF